MTIPDWDEQFPAVYKNGFLVWSAGDVSNPAASWASLGIVSFSGSPPKVKFKADSGYGQYGSSMDGEYCEWDPHVGKMISTSPTYVGAARASQGDEQVAFAPGEETAPLAATPPLSIDDVPGTYSCKLTSTIYYPYDGTKTKENDSDVVTITKTDNQTLNMSASAGNMYIHYGAGVLLIANVDNDTLDTDADFGILIAKGKPEKISLKGKFYSARSLGAPEGDEFEVTKVSCKQTSP